MNHTPSVLPLLSALLLCSTLLLYSPPPTTFLPSIQVLLPQFATGPNGLVSSSAFSLVPPSTYGQQMTAPTLCLHPFDDFIVCKHITLLSQQLHCQVKAKSVLGEQSNPVPHCFVSSPFFPTFVHPFVGVPY